MEDVDRIDNGIDYASCITYPIYLILPMGSWFGGTIFFVQIIVFFSPTVLIQCDDFFFYKSFLLLYLVLVCTPYNIVAVYPREILPVKGGKD